MNVEGHTKIRTKLIESLSVRDFHTCSKIIQNSFFVAKSWQLLPSFFYDTLEISIEKVTNIKA